MAESTIQLGVIGCGWAGSQAVQAAKVVPRTTVIAVADIWPDRCQSVAKEFSVPETYEDCHNLLANSQIDAVYLATSPDGRLQMVLDALEAEKHVLVQKPHAIRAPEILEMESAARDAGKVLQFCYFMRHFPHNRKIRAAVFNGQIGDPYHARIFGKYNSIPPLNQNNRWLHAYGYKGGSLGQHYSHELDLAWWWMGCPDPMWAFGAKHALYPVYDGPEGPAEDYFTGIVGFEGDKTIQIDCTRWLHCDTSPTVIELYGTEGDITQGKISRSNDDKEYMLEDADEPLDVPHSEQTEKMPVFYYEIEHFALAVAGEVEPDVNAADSYIFMKILDALYDSARDGQKIVID